MNEPIGRLGSFKPALARRTAFETALTASSWPIRREWRISSSFNSRSVSVSASLETGTPVQLDTTFPISSTVTSLFSFPCFSFQLFFVFSTSSRSFCSASRKEAAFSNSWLWTAASFSFLMLSSFASNSFRFGGVVKERRRTFEPASSIKSIALSGRKRSEM